MAPTITLCFVCRGFKRCFWKLTGPRGLLMGWWIPLADSVTASNFLFISHRRPHRHHPELSPPPRLVSLSQPWPRSSPSQASLPCASSSRPSCKIPFLLPAKKCELFLALWLVKCVVITSNQSAAKTPATAEGGAATMKSGTQLLQVTDKTGSKRVEMLYQL